MDLLMSAADAVFSANTEEDLTIPLTPKKGARSVFGEITNTVNISPEKFSNSPLQTLFTAPTLSTPKTKSRILSSAVTTPGSRGVIGRGSNGKSLSYPSPGSEAQTPSRDMVSPHLPTSGGSGKSPLTPMSNLKLLTRIASMEESLTSKKVLFQNQSVKEKDGKNLSNLESLLISSTTVKNISSLRRHNSDCLSESQSKIQVSKSAGALCKLPTNSECCRPSSPGNLVIEDVGHLPSLDETNTNRSSEGSRKDKSLGLLSEKFLEYFPMEVSYLETPRRLVIDEVASMLGTERRRVYDIINVLESLNMATRVQKNMYQWMGKLHLEETLGRLKALGHKLNIHAQLHALQRLDHDFKFPQRIKTSNDGEKADTRREKSLGILCQKFLMLLLVSPEPHIISLDSAVRMLVGEAGEDSERLRTRGRRLYDIANVLTSIGLVKRVPTAKAFQYIGPEIEAVTSEEDTFGVLQRHSLLPSRLGSIGGKENTSFGDHDVTPSNVAPSVPKRGRPRKLSTDFYASALPAAKRSKLQRTRSEDITTSKQTRKFTRHPSLHDICQVAEVEREKLLQKEQQQCSYSNGGPTYCRTSCSSSLKKKLEKPTMNAAVQPVNMISSVASLLRCRLASHGKIPVALTFQGCHSQWVPDSQRSSQPKMEERSRTPLGLIRPSAGQQMLSFAHQNSEGYRVFHHEAGKEVASQRSFPNSEFISKSVQPVNQFICTSTQELQATPLMMVKSGGTMLTGLQQGAHGAPVGATASKNTRVIKVITKMGGSSQQESSTVITVLPASQTSSHSSATSKQYIVQASGGFQQVSSGTYTNGHKVTGSSSSTVEGTTFPESKQGSLNPFGIYAMSSNQIRHRAFAKMSYPKSPVISRPQKDSLEPASCDSLSTNQLSLSQVLQTQVPATASGTQVISGSAGVLPNTVTGPRSFIVCNQKSSRQWQPSPDGSSTDSELEEIFGNAFKYTRPKSLVSKDPHKSEPPVDKM